MAGWQRVESDKVPVSSTSWYLVGVKLVTAIIPRTLAYCEWCSMEETIDYGELRPVPTPKKLRRANLASRSAFTFANMHLSSTRTMLWYFHTCHRNRYKIVPLTLESLKGGFGFDFCNISTDVYLSTPWHAAIGGWKDPLHQCMWIDLSKLPFHWTEYAMCIHAALTASCIDCGFALAQSCIDPS